MKKNWVKRLLGGVILGAAMLLSVTALSGVKAEALADGTYTVPVNYVMPGTSISSSMTKKYLAQTATVVVKDGTDQVSIGVNASDSDFAKILSMSVGDNSAFSRNALTFTTHNEPKSLVGTYAIQILPTTIMHPQSEFQFTWPADTTNSNGANSQSDASSASDSITSETSTSDGEGDTKAPSLDSNKDNNSTSDSTSASQITNNEKITNLTYEVLQADKKSKSAADQYYTHTAKVEKQSDGTYKITMEVKYAKDSGMTAKGFVPLTANGTKVSDISYGTDGNYYTASFSFNVPSLSVLNNLVKGTIHVTVPTMSISSDFDIYYKFTGATTDNTASSNADSTSGDNGADSGYTETSPIGVSATNNNTKKKAATSNGKLPQTNEQQQVLLGVAGLLSLVMVIATVIYRRKMAK